MILFAIPLGVSLTLVALEPAWSRILFVLLSLALVAANVDTAARVQAVRRTTGSKMLFLNEVVGTLGVVVIVVLPWVLGGFDPTREDLTWAILVAFATAFLSLITLVMSVFDLASSR